MGGDVTGTVGASVVGNDSHTHNTQYYTEAEINAMDIHATATVAGPLTITGQLINLENDADAEITEIDTSVNMDGGATKIPTSLSVKTYVDNEVGGIGGADKTRTIAMPMSPNNGATANSNYGILINADGEGFFANVKLPANCDTSQDVHIIFSWRCMNDNANAYMDRWCAARKTDGSEEDSWNIVSGQSYYSRGGDDEFEFYIYTDTYTIPAASIDAGDLIMWLLRSSESGINEAVRTCDLQYEVI